MDEFEKEIKTSFLAEAKDHLTSVEQCFLDLERQSDDGSIINNIFRLAHNIKGASRAVGFDDLADFTHKLESLVLALKEKKLKVTPAIVDLLLLSNDYLTKTIEALQEDLNASHANPELANALIAALQDSGQEQQATTQPTVSVPVEDLSNVIAIAMAENEVLSKVDSSVAPSVPTLAPAQAAASAPPANKTKDDSIRVNLARIEKLLNNIGELSILQTVITQQSLERGTVVSSTMREAISSMSKIVKETQSLSMGLRMMPVKQTFQKMQRIVRDSSKGLGKSVELHLLGEETEVDKTVIEALGDPLVHIIRNAVDHGLEDPAGRETAGKSPTGHIHLSSYHRAGQVVIEVRDDGKGLDAEKLVSKAKAKGLIPADANLTLEQAHQLIFLPGFSTKEAVTDLSGRGVGMDVVKTNISALQGQIEIETALGRGSCFRILLPLTLAIIDSVVVRSGESRYVIPLSQINEFYCPTPSDLNSIAGKTDILTLREETLAVFRLESLLGQQSAIKKDLWNQTALVVNDGSSSRFAVMVDKVIAQQQVVIKAFGDELKGKPGLMGSAILGDGKPALILDLHELSKMAQGTNTNKKRQSTITRSEAA